MVLVLKWPFFQLFFLSNIAQENVFNDFLERKNAFLGYKNKKFKSRKIDFFPKGWIHGFGRKMAKIRKIDIFPLGLTHRFGPTMAISPTFFFLGKKG